MPIDFNSLEESLKTFLSEEHSDRYNSRSANLYKYNNLKIYMDPKKSSRPHLIIRIGISEAMYEIEGGDKISGSLGPEERTIKRWLERNLTRYDWLSSWKAESKAKPVTMHNEELDK